MTSRREQQRLETRQRLYTAALQIFRRDGYNECSIEEIAKLAEVSRGTFISTSPPKRGECSRHCLSMQKRHLSMKSFPWDDQTAIEGVLTQPPQPWPMRSVEPQLWQAVGLVALRSTAERLNAEPRGIRAELGRRFALAAERQEVSALVTPQVLADFYLANAFAVAVSWSTAPTHPLETVLTGAAYLFLHGVKNPPRWCHRKPPSPLHVGNALTCQLTAPCNGGGTQRRDGKNTVPPCGVNPHRRCTLP